MVACLAIAYGLIAGIANASADVSATRDREIAPRLIQLAADANANPEIPRNNEPAPADPTNQFFAIPTANPTRDYAVLILGSSGQFANNFSGFLQFSAAAGLQNETNYGVVLGLRKQF